MREAHRWDVVVKTHHKAAVVKAHPLAVVLKIYPMAADTAAHGSIHPLALLYLILKER